MAEIEEKGKREGGGGGRWAEGGGWKEEGRGERDLDFSGHLVKKKKEASKCAVHGGGGGGVHKVAMFWLGLPLASRSCLCSV